MNDHIRLREQEIGLTISYVSRRFDGLDLVHCLCIWLANRDELSDMLIATIAFVDKILSVW